jgi:hypothetical protein
MTDWESDQLRQFRAELRADPTLVEAILNCPDVFPPASARPKGLLIRTDAESVDLGLSRALALAADGILAKVELSE